MKFLLCSLLLASSNAFTANQGSSIRRVTSLQMASDDDTPIVMVNGMPGPMATAAAEACLRKGLTLTPVAATGPEIEAQTITVTDPVTGRSADVRLIPADQEEEYLAAVKAQKEAAGENNLVAIDFTHPTAVNSNAKFYVANKVPFVMGTTGGDREQLMKDVQGHPCVIAPNMAKQIVAIQAGLEDLAAKYPGAFDSYTLSVEESHQKTKADTSGTAKAVINSLKVLGNCPDYGYDDIKMIRDDKEAMDFGVSEKALKGHAFHTYTFTSADKSVHFVLKHNVEGRAIYAEGTADGVKFLAKKLKAGQNSQVFNMIDVLKEGAM